MLSNPNRVYFDIENAVLVGDKQQIIFEQSPIKEIRLAQFETNPFIVRAVVTFEEDFDTSKLRLINSGGSVILVINPPPVSNDYFNTVYDETAEKLPYSYISAKSQFIQKMAIPVDTPQNASQSTISEIEKAFENTTLSNADGKTYDTTISLDLSSKLKMRTKYFINQYTPKNNGLLVSGIGQLTTAKVFYLNSPKRLVIDLPNTYLERIFRNREISICQSDSCSDSAKIGQFDYNTARIVITSDDAEKYMPIYSKDSQSLFLINSDKLNHTSLENKVSNINKVFVKKTDSKTGELIFSFTAPVVYSVVRNDNSINLYLFNVKSYNEQNFSETVANSPFKQLGISLLPQTGIKAAMKLSKKDVVKIETGVDGKAMKITVTRNGNPEDDKSTEKPAKKTKSSNKVVIDPGHGGTDYGAIREGVNEKDITLDISQRVASILRSKGIKAVLTRTDDTFVSLEDRVSFSEAEEPEIFVSIHVNSAVSETPHGIETHWYHDYSKPLSETVHKHILKELPKSNDRGLFKSMFYVINHTTCPAILCEIGFLSNPDERNELITEARKQKTAKAIADGIIEYMRGK
jgi:N-acetylmuramoyl-L-alanine amidase